MSRFFKDILYCLFLTAFIGFGINIHENKEQSRNNIAYKRWYMDNNSSEIKTLLLGNSHFENSLNPYALGDSIFDCAISGKWIYYDLCLLRQKIDCMSNLKTVIYPMAYITPYVNPHYHFNKESDTYYLTNYSCKMHIPYDRFPRKIFFSNYFTSGLWGSHYGKVNPMEPCDSLGYARLDGSLNVYPENLSYVPQWTDNNKYLKKDTTEYVSYLKNIASLCNSHNVRFIIVSPPLHSDYIGVTSEKGRMIMSKIIGSVAEEYHVEYKNYMENEHFRSDSMYANYSHLNHIGATQFAELIKRDFNL